MTDTTQRSSAEIDLLLRDAAAWRLISLLFECPSPGWHDKVSALGDECGDDELRGAAVAAQAEASEGLHHSLFGPGGPVSPREATYAYGVQLGYLMSELSAIYDAFAFRPGTIEPDDHVSVETAFMSYLAMKQAYALASGSAESAGVTNAAASDFRASHLSNMVEPIARALESGGPSYLALAAQALFLRVGKAPRRGLPVIQNAETGDGDGESCGESTGCAIE